MSLIKIYLHLELSPNMTNRCSLHLKIDFKVEIDIRWSFTYVHLFMCTTTMLVIRMRRML
jgi:hypothetical protein